MKAGCEVPSVEGFLQSFYSSYKYPFRLLLVATSFVLFTTPFGISSLVSNLFMSLFDVFYDIDIVDTEHD